MASFIYSDGAGAMSEPTDVKTVMNAAAERLVQGNGPFALKKNDEELGSREQRKDALATLEDELGAGSVGDVYRMRDSEQVVFKVRQAVPASDALDTSGNAKIDAVWGFIRGKHKDSNFLGAFVCKNVLGSNTPSQHSYGNAVDAGARTMDELRKMADELVAEAKGLSLAHVIVADRIWSPSAKWHVYTGEFHHHVHVDCDPNFSGPCGVKG